MIRTPKVSVLMTVFNGDQFLDQAIRSIINQGLGDFEFIVVNDGSEDRTEEILKGWVNIDKRMQVIHQANSGIPRAANTGLAICQGEFVARIDADDIAMPGRLLSQIDYIERTNTICVGCFVDLIDSKGRFLTVLKPPQDNETIQKLALAGHSSIVHSAAMIKRESLEAIGGYDEYFSYSLDLDLWLRLGELGKLGNVPERLLQYRLHEESISELKGEHQRLFARKACERAWRRRGISGNFEASERWRPTKERHSQLRYMTKYGWWAFNSRQRWTAMIYGIKAVGVMPWSAEGWRLLLCAAIKSPK